MIFAPPHYPSKVKGYSQLLLCEAPKPIVDAAQKNKSMTDGGNNMNE